MKKIEAIVQTGLRDKVVSAIKKNGVGGVTIRSFKVVSAIKKNGVGGVTIHQVQGQGAQDPPLVGQYFSKDMIICVVDDPKLDDILDSIANVACTGTKGDGKVFGSSACNICN